LFGAQFIQQLLAAARPHLEALISEVLCEMRIPVQGERGSGVNVNIVPG
jgi:hypothetical protein